jgi:CRP-like cAMP-binding protein
MFGTLTVGMAFGETALLQLNESKSRFYNAIALTDVHVLAIKRAEFLKIFQA